jgi:hypothetical protein
MLLFEDIGHFFLSVNLSPKIVQLVLLVGIFQVSSITFLTNLVGEQGAGDPSLQDYCFSRVPSTNQPDGGARSTSGQRLATHWSLEQRM